MLTSEAVNTEKCLVFFQWLFFCL